jgi:hypothetical protein
MLDTGRLEESIDELVKRHNEELQEKQLWELWLHKEFEGNPSYEKFRNMYLQPVTTKQPVKKHNNTDDFEAIVKRSNDLLNSVCAIK